MTNRRSFTSRMRSGWVLVLLCSCFSALAQESGLSPSDTSEVRFINSRKFYIYKVNKGETLYSLSKKFRIPMEEIREFNKDIDADGVKAKTKLWIPAYSWKNKNEVKTVREEIKPEEVTATDHVLDIALITGLSLSRQYLTPDSLLDSTYVTEPITRDIQTNLEFAEGLLLAGNELRNSRPKIRVTLIDSEQDSVHVRTELKQTPASKYDLIVTNETGGILRAANEFSQKYNIPLLACGINTTDIIRLNPHAAAIFPSSLAQCHEMGEFCAENMTNLNVILVKTGIQKENERSVAFREGLQKNNHSMRIRTADIVKYGVNVVIDSLAKNKKNLIFVPTSNEDMASNVLGTLRDTTDDFDISVIGLPTWQYFESVSPELFQTDRVFLFNSGFISYGSQNVEAFRRSFRDKYQNEPEDAAFIGYDALKFILHAAGKKGSVAWNDAPKEIEGLFSVYKIREIETGQCFENQHLHVIVFRDLLPEKFNPASH